VQQAASARWIEWCSAMSTSAHCSPGVRRQPTVCTAARAVTPSTLPQTAESSEQESRTSGEIRRKVPPRAASMPSHTEEVSMAREDVSAIGHRSHYLRRPS